MDFDTAENLLKLIADKSRLTIIKQLSKTKKLCGNDLLKFIDCKQATLSHHMSLLTEAKLVFAKKSGSKIYYSLNKELLSSLTNFIYKDKTSEKVSEEDKPVKEVKEVKIKVENPDIVRDTKRTLTDKKEEKDLPTFLL